MELKPSPFCGNQARYETWGTPTPCGWRVRCTNILNCGAMIEFYDKKQQAAQSWNTRTKEDTDGMD